MSNRDRLPPAPCSSQVDGRQQGPPTRAAASDPRRSLRDARRSLPSTPGDGLPQRPSRNDAMVRVDTASWQQGHAAGLSGLPYWLGRRNLAAKIDSWSWISGYIEGEAARLKRGSQATSKLDANREY